MGGRGGSSVRGGGGVTAGGVEMENAPRADASSFITDVLGQSLGATPKRPEMRTSLYVRYMDAMNNGGNPTGRFTRQQLQDMKLMNDYDAHRAALRTVNDWMNVREGDSPDALAESRRYNAYTRRDWENAKRNWRNMNAYLRSKGVN